MPRLCPILLSIVMVHIAVSCVVVGFLLFLPINCHNEKTCPDGRLCPGHWQCCELGCCAPSTPAPVTRDDGSEDAYGWSQMMPLLCVSFGICAILGLCCYCCCIKRQHHCMCALGYCMRRTISERDSAGSIYPPPGYSRCGSFHNSAPPPYSEVQSKPDLYPLVITCGEGDGKPGGNYLMVHYFRNYVIRAPGSLSATSTAESLNSSFICNAANEANTAVPPPYSYASNFDDCVNMGCGPRTLLRSLSSLTDPNARAARFRENLIHSPLDPSYEFELDLMDDLYFNGEKPTVGLSPSDPYYATGGKPKTAEVTTSGRYHEGIPKPLTPLHNRPPVNFEESKGYEKELFGLRTLFACPSPDDIQTPSICESPPQPISPNEGIDPAILTQIEERRYRQQENLRKSRKSSLYMPLSIAYPLPMPVPRIPRVLSGVRSSSRSAPATPCGVLQYSFSQRIPTSRGSRTSRNHEESNPLLGESEGFRSDHKF